MSQLQIAKDKLLCGDYTCVMCKGEKIFTSTHRGIRPLVECLESSDDFCGFVAADKVVGKATAYLYVLLGVTAVYAKVISKPALEVLQRHGIVIQYDTVVENIINRKGDGICPFESAVLTIGDADSAYIAIKDKLRQLNSNN